MEENFAQNVCLFKMTKIGRKVRKGKVKKIKRISNVSTFNSTNEEKNLNVG